jgi:hypothetical protein
VPEADNLIRLWTYKGVMSQFFNELSRGRGNRLGFLAQINATERQISF